MSSACTSSSRTDPKKAKEGSNLPEVKVDGSFMEGGGQILRNSIAYAVLLGFAMEIDSIRGQACWTIQTWIKGAAPGRNSISHGYISRNAGGRRGSVDIHKIYTQRKEGSVQVRAIAPLTLKNITVKTDPPGRHSAASDSVPENSDRAGSQGWYQRCQCASYRVL
eukprot:1366139-Amorphochlora_amoeboformis.AAC.2